MKSTVRTCLNLFILSILAPHLVCGDDIETVISLLSEARDGAKTTAMCPAGYTMIGCKLADGSTSSISDGLHFDGGGCAASARGATGVRVRLSVVTNHIVISMMVSKKDVLCIPRTP